MLQRHLDFKKLWSSNSPNLFEKNNIGHCCHHENCYHSTSMTATPILSSCLIQVHAMNIPCTMYFTWDFLYFYVGMPRFSDCSQFCAACVCVAVAVMVIVGLQLQTHQHCHFLQQKYLHLTLLSAGWCILHPVVCSMCSLWRPTRISLRFTRSALHPEVFLCLCKQE